MHRNVVAGFLVGCCGLGSVPALAESADEAAKAFAEGKTLLAKADFDGASQAFREATQTHPDNKEYARQYGMLRQIIRTRAQIANEQDPDRWWGMARSLCAYYHGHKIHSEALPLDREIHRRRPTVDSAVMLAETQLALGRPSEAAETLRPLAKEDATKQTKVLLGLAFARQGRIDDAKAVIEKVTLEDDAGPRLFLQLAGLRALTGDSNGALEALTRSFELTPPSELDTAKAEAKVSKDFSALTKSSGFAEALRARSKVKDSKGGKGTRRGTPKDVSGDDKGGRERSED